MIHLKKVILWSNKNQIREVSFNTNGITVLIGDGTIGKSALINIIDYCLGSSECEIPVGLVRKCCSWFGIQLCIDNVDYLVARRSPRRSQNTDEMFLLQLDENNVPNQLETNATRDEVLLFFNTHFHLTNLNINLEDRGRYIIPSYRDTVAINFFPQELLLDKKYNYYKQSDENHNKRLQAMFPFMLGLQPMEEVLQRSYLATLKRELNALEKKKEKEINVLKDWETECQEQLLTAVRLGVVEDENIPTNFYNQLVMLKQIEDRLINRKIIITKTSLDQLNREISQLEAKKDELQSLIFKSNERLRVIKKQRLEIADYHRSVKNSDSKKLSEWIKNDVYLVNQMNGLKDGYARSIYDRVVKTIEDEEKGIRYFEHISVSLDRESKELLEELDRNNIELNSVSDLLESEYKKSKTSEDYYTSLKAVYSYLGKVQTYIKMYDKLKENTTLDEQMKVIANKIVSINKDLERFDTDNKKSFEMYMNASLYDILAALSTEYKTDKEIFFNTKNMSLSINDEGVIHDKKNVGSGANHVQYHIVLALLLQTYIQNKVKNKITFDFVIFDQASEAFFPSKDKNINRKMEEARLNKTDDYVRLHDLYEVVAYVQKNNCPQTQIIILEHAGREYWENAEGKLYNNSITILDWKETHEKLVPEDWEE